MIGKMKKLEQENKQLKRNIKSYGLGMFTLGALMGVTLILLKDEKLQIDKVSGKFKLLKRRNLGECDLIYDEETVEVLEEEKDNFE